MAEEKPNLLVEFQHDFLEAAKVRLKDRWDTLDPEVKKAVEFASKYGAKVAARVASGESPHENPLASDLLHLNSVVKNVELLGVLHFKAFMDEMLAEAAKIGGSLFKKFLKAAILG